MPYITEARKNKLLGYGPWPPLDPTLEPGDTAWAISENVAEYLKKQGVSFRTLNDMVGVLDNVKVELQRRVVGPYEESKLNDAERRVDPFLGLTL